MDFMPLIPFLGVSVPESIVLYYMVIAITGKKEAPLSIMALSLLTSLFSYTVRLIPMFFGIHSLLQVVLMIILLNLFLQLPWRAAATAMILASVVLGLTEGIFVPLLSRIFSLTLERIISDPLLRILFTLPHLIFLSAMSLIIIKQRWQLPVLMQLMGISNKADAKSKKRLLSQTYLFILCLVQALMLTLFKISFHIYAAGVYPSFSLDALVEITSTLIMVSTAATIVLAGYLLRVTDRDARLETELHYFKERHYLNLKIQVERHDFYNHLTAVYGYLKAGHYARAEGYIENLYEAVRNIKNLLNIEPPELAALLNVKQEEARAKGIEFHWNVDMENNNIPLSPEDLTHLSGNLLDNAIEAAESSNAPRVDFHLACNKLGLELRISNNGNPIPDDMKRNIFTAGYTTKNANRHCGLGLYIITQIVTRHGGQLELKEPEDYPGVEFVIYIPWSR